MRLPSRTSMLAATFLSNIGSGASATAILLVLSQRENGTRLVASVAMASVVGAMTGSALGGWLADRTTSVLRVIVSGDLIAMLASLAFVFSSPRSTPTFALLGFATTFGSLLGMTGRQVLASYYFESALGEFNSWSSNIASAGAVVGSLVASGAFFRNVDIRWIVTGDAVSFAIAAALRWGLPRPKDQSTEIRAAKGFLGSIADLLRDSRAWRVVVIVALLQVSEAVAAKLFVPFLIGQFHANPLLIPVIETVAIAGGFGGAALCEVTTRNASRERLVLPIGLAVLAALLAGYALAPTVWLLLPVEAAIAIVATVVTASLINLGVSGTQTHLRGRYFALLTVVGATGQLLSLAAAGALTSVLPLRTTFLLAAIPVLMSVAFVWPGRQETCALDR